MAFSEASQRSAAVHEDCVVALAGNPNVGKSTLFNRLTGSRQHTGNWSGKTVSCAWGRCRSAKRRYTLVDIPGTHSLLTRSAEETLARDFICFGDAAAVVVVCDATCLARGLTLLLQILECGARALLCVNLMDEAERKGVRLDLALLEARLGAPVLGLSARQRRSRARFLAALDDLFDRESAERFLPRYPPELEAALARLTPELSRLTGGRLDSRWLSLRLLEGDEGVEAKADELLSGALSGDEGLTKLLAELRGSLDREALADTVSACLVRAGESLCRDVVSQAESGYSRRDRRLDRLLTGRALGYPLMLALLALVLYLTIAGANVLSDRLSLWLMGLEDVWERLLSRAGAPPLLTAMLCEGAWRVLAWVVSVMLPPMAVFFPLFTLLEDLGYLPRVAFNLDRPFQRCGACGKQALTMCMGFGCNAAGVVGCRIVDSERERLLAVLTNSLVPCNGRFPMLLALLTVFFAGSARGGALTTALLLTALIALSVVFSLLATRLLSGTVLRGKPSSYLLELPPFRRPQWGQVLLRSLLDRTLFVLGRAAAVAAPAGLLLWLAANLRLGGESLAALAAEALDPFGRALGMDGTILLAFILGLPANETVLPIMLMLYSAQSSLSQVGSLEQIGILLRQNGWTELTALCVLLFTLLHWPCSTTLLTVRKETGRWSWTALAALLPTVMGLLLCALIAALGRLLGLG